MNFIRALASALLLSGPTPAAALVLIPGQASSVANGGVESLAAFGDLGCNDTQTIIWVSTAAAWECGDAGGGGGGVTPGQLADEFGGLTTTYLSLSGGSMSGAIVADNGSSGTPGIQFGGTTRGFYGGGFGTLIAKANGSDVLTIDPSASDFSSDLGVQKLRFADGTAASPGLQFTNANNAGIFRGGASTLNISAGGVGVGTFTAAGLFVNGEFNFGDDGTKSTFTAGGDLSPHASIILNSRAGSDPAIQWADDPDSGITKKVGSGSGETTIFGNSTEIVTFKHAGGVGNLNLSGTTGLTIGGSSVLASDRRILASAGTAASPGFKFNVGGGNYGIYSVAEDVLAVSADSAQVQRWDVGGSTVAKVLTVEDTVFATKVGSYSVVSSSGIEIGAEIRFADGTVQQTAASGGGGGVQLADNNVWVGSNTWQQGDSPEGSGVTRGTAGGAVANSGSLVIARIPLATANNVLWTRGWIAVREDGASPQNGSWRMMMRAVNNAGTVNIEFQEVINGFEAPPPSDLSSVSFSWGVNGTDLELTLTNNQAFQVHFSGWFDWTVVK